MTTESVEFQSFEPSWLARYIPDQWIRWDAAREVWRKRIAEVVQYVFATSTRETANRMLPWSHSTHIPKICQIHDNLGANYSTALFGNRKFFVFEPGTPDENTQAKRRAIEAYLTTKHDYSGFFDVMRQCLDDWVLYGNVFASVEYVREARKDPKTGQDITIYEGPKVVRRSPYDVVFDHTANSFQEAPKIFRSLISRSTLMRRIEESSEGDFDLEAVERIKSWNLVVSRLSEGEIDKHIQQRFDGFNSTSAYFRSGKVELMEYVGDVYEPFTQTLHKDAIVTVADRRFVLRIKTASDFNNIGQYYHAPWRRRPDNLWGMGPLDNLLGMQYLINHLENARADGFDQMLSPDRVFKGQVQVEQVGAVKYHYIDDANGDVTNLLPDRTVLSADMQIQYKEAQMEAYAGAPKEAMGIRTPGEKTAFEVQQLQNAASRLFQTRIEQFEQMFLEPILNAELEIAVKNLNVTDKVKTLDDDTGVTDFLSITVDDLTSRGKLRARGASHFAKRAQLVQELNSFETVLKNDPKLAVHFPAKARAEAWNAALNFDQFELFKPFGQIAEDLDAQKNNQAAQDVADQHTAAQPGNGPPGLPSAMPPDQQVPA